MKEIDIEEHKNNTVVKANELIEAKGSLSGTAQKMLCSLISMLRADDTDLQEYALKRDEYLRLIGSTSNNDVFLKQQAEELMKNPFWIDGKLFNWCSMVDIEVMPGYIVFDIHRKLKPYLLDLKNRGNFTQYKIINILSLKGEYAPRFYELLILEWNQHTNYKGTKSFTFEMSVEYLRDTLKIPVSYLYADIKRNILDKCKLQFKEKTDISFDYKEKKRGRKVEILIITIFENNKGSNDFLREERAFIEHIRKNYVNKQLLSIMDKEEKHFILQCSEKGRLYDLNNHSQDLTKEQSKYFWSLMFKLAKEGKLKILTDNI